MYKSLVKRSSFQRIIVSDIAPITMLVEGDEVYVTMLEPSGLNAPTHVTIQRQTERELVKLLGGEHSYVDQGGGWEQADMLVRFPLHQRREPMTRAVLDEGINLLCGFSDTVTFSVGTDARAGSVNVAEVLIETIHYKARK